MRSTRISRARAGASAPFAALSLSTRASRSPQTSPRVVRDRIAALSAPSERAHVVNACKPRRIARVASRARTPSTRTASHSRVLRPSWSGISVARASSRASARAGGRKQHGERSARARSDERVVPALGAIRGDGGEILSGARAGAKRRGDRARRREWVGKERKRD